MLILEKYKYSSAIASVEIIAAITRRSHDLNKIFSDFKLGNISLEIK
ncbi:MAG: hypothetical protein V7L29_08165 [Nostoc sp.]